MRTVNSKSRSRVGSDLNLLNLSPHYAREEKEDPKQCSDSPSCPLVEETPVPLWVTVWCQLLTAPTMPFQGTTSQRMKITWQIIKGSQVPLSAFCTCELRDAGADSGWYMLTVHIKSLSRALKGI